MARLRCASRAERLLIPAFVLFFFLLYPMRWANRPGGRLAAAAGGCVLVRAEALARAGGLEAIRGALIDDLALARAREAVGRRHPPRAEPGRRVEPAARTPTSAPSGGWCGAARSPSCAAPGPSWRRSTARHAADVRRAAGLRRRGPGGRGGRGRGLGRSRSPPGRRRGPSWRWSRCRRSRAFDLPARWALALPLAGVLYALMTVDSALRGRSARRRTGARSSAGTRRS